MSYVGEIKKIGEWLKKETKIRNVSYQVDKSEQGLYALIYFTDSIKTGDAKRARFLNLTVRVSSPIDLWEDGLSVVEAIENNLQTERENDIIVDEVTNFDNVDTSASRFIVDITIKKRVQTGRIGE